MTVFSALNPLRTRCPTSSTSFFISFISATVLFTISSMLESCNFIFVFLLRLIAGASVVGFDRTDQMFRTLCCRLFTAPSRWFTLCSSTLVTERALLAQVQSQSDTTQTTTMETLYSNIVLPVTLTTLKTRFTSQLRFVTSSGELLTQNEAEFIQVFLGKETVFINPCHAK